MRTERKMARILRCCLLVALELGDVLSAVIEVSAGGGTGPTYKFSDRSGMQLANLTALDSAVVASMDLVTGSGNSLDALAAAVAALQKQRIPTFANRNRLQYAGNQVTTLAGTATAAFADGTGAAASFQLPNGVAVSPDGTLLFVADSSNNRIRQIVISTGVVTTLAGSGTATFADGSGAAASFRYPYGVAVSPDGTLLFVADYGNNRIRQIVISTGVVTTLAGSGTFAFADGSGAAASFKNPAGVAVSPDGTLLFVADYGNNRIRQIVISTGVVTTLAGSGTFAFADGSGAAASFKNPAGVAVSPDGTLLFVADYSNNRIRQIVISTGVVTTLAGSGTFAFADGTGAAASFRNPYGVAVSPDGTLLFVVDNHNHRIRQIVILTGVVTTLAGSGTGTFADGTGTAASFFYPRGVAVSPNGTLLFVADFSNHCIRMIQA